jgi:hypothetical protein
MAITVNEQGQVLQNGQWVTTDQSDEFKAAIAKAKQEGAVVNANTTFAIVEKGDWLLKIADQYGANGRQLAYTDNKQYADNPNLIHEGEAVVVNGGDPKAGDEPGNPLAGTPSGASTPAAETATDTTPPNPKGYQTVLSMLSSTQWDSGWRQAALQNYLGPLTPEQRQAAVKQLDADLDANRILGPVFDRGAIDRDIQTVVQELSGTA